MALNKRSRLDVPGIRDDSLKKTLKEIKASIRKIAGDRFRLVLFGSRANGTAQPDSDVDLLVVLPDELDTFDLKEKIRDAVYDFSLKTSYLFSVILVSETLLRERAGFMFFDFVEKEGITI